MVAAPETQVQQQEAPAQGQSTVEAIKQSNSGKESSNEGQQPVNGLTVVDESGSTSPVNETSDSSSVNLPPPDVARNIPCRFFPLGTCKYGEQCIFSHGIPGVAGSPGVPASPSVQPQVAASQGQNQNQGQNSSASELPQPAQNGRNAQQPMQGMPMYYPEQAYMQGVPMYYPEQALQYGFQPPFSPEQGYYHFAPPPFQAYPQHYQQFAPHAYYAPPPPPPPVPAPLAVSVHPSIPSSTVDTPITPSPVPSPSQVVEAGSSTSPAPSQQPPSSSETPESTGSPQPAVGSDGTPISRAPASLHTFFQTAASMPPSSSHSVPVSTTSPIAGPSNSLPPVSASPNSFVKPLPGRLAGPRRSIGGMSQNGFAQGVNVAGGAGGGKPRRSFGGSRPPCSFFEANRCKNGDECSFVHLLPDGSDARTLGRGMIGSDGRTDSPEATGGTPPAWLINQKALRFSGANGANMKKHVESGAAAGGMGMVNGAGGNYAYRERNNGLPHQGRRARYEEDQHTARYPNGSVIPPSQQLVEGQQQQQPAQFHPALLAQPLQTQRPALPVDGSLPGRIPPGGGGTPQLVAAINGLTRRIPPAHLQQPQQTPSVNPQERSSSAVTPSNSEPRPAAAQSSRESSQQRVPTVNDFPALGSPAAPLSPAVEKESYTSAVGSTPAPAQPTQLPKESESSSKQEVPIASPSAENDGFVMVSHEDAEPSSSTASTTQSEPKKEAEPTSSAKSSSPSPPVSTPASSTPAPPTSRPVQPPKFTMSFASIAKAASTASAAPSVEKKNVKSTPPQVTNKSAESKPVNESAPVKVESKSDPKKTVEDDKDDGFITKTSKKSKKSSAKMPLPVSVKA
ncbi:hypothetical protein JCM3765_003899 [Sporobolomyces pararoseus]